MAGRKARGGTVAQAWVELTREDPEALSALAVARESLRAGRGLRSLRRLRLFELSGPLPARPGLEALLHRSIQFYNPHKERCAVRASPRDPMPFAAGDPGAGAGDEPVVLVFDRGEERREGAERWWRHETGLAIEVREGVAWVLGLEPGTRDPAGVAAELAVVRDRRHGLFANPHAQEHRVVAGGIPLPWMTAGARGGGKR